MKSPRTWPYGTVRTIKVVEVVRARTIGAVACEDVERPAEAYALVLPLGDIADVAKDEVRPIEFVAGGPTGGHWRFQTAEPHTAEPSQEARA